MAARCPVSSRACASRSSPVTGSSSSPTARAAWAVAPELLTAYLEREPRTPEPWHAAGDPSVLELVGTWHWGPSVSTAWVVGEHLVLGEPGRHAVRASR